MSDGATDAMLEDRMWEETELLKASQATLLRRSLENDDDSIPEHISDKINTLQRESSDGSTAGYYGLPSDARELQDLISHKNMNAQIGEIFRECYRYGQASHSDYMRGINKILFYANAEKKRLQKAWEE